MRVLQLIDTLDAGGAERMAVNIANGLASSRETTSILCATRRGGALERSIASDVHFNILYKKRAIDYKAIQSFFVLLKKHNVEIIHAHSTSLFLAVIAKIRYPKLKVVWHNHFGNSSSIQGVRLIMYKFLSRFVAISIALNDELLKWSKTYLKAGHHVILNNFVKLDEKEILSTVLKGEPGKRVVCLANLRVEKNHLFLMNAFKKIQSQYPEWTLHLVGADTNDLYSKSIKKFIEANKLEQRIFLYGSRPDVAAILLHCDIGVLVSTFEAEPLSLIEYGFAGLPVIVTDVGNCSMIVGNAGIIIDHSQKELQRALEQLFDSAECRTLIGTRFRESVHKNYSQESTLKKLTSLYTSLIS